MAFAQCDGPSSDGHVIVYLDFPLLHSGLSIAVHNFYSDKAKTAVDCMVVPSGGQVVSYGFPSHHDITLQPWLLINSSLQHLNGD